MKRILFLTSIAFYLLLAPALAGEIARSQDSRVALSKRAGSKTAESISAITPSGRIRGFLVREKRNKGGEAWLRITVPFRKRPTMWTKAKEMSLQKTALSLLLLRSLRRLRLLQEGKTVWQSPVVVGKKATPTPLGLFALDDIYRSRGDEGPWVFKTTAYSPTIKRWKGGQARIAIHGRRGELRAPLGSASSNGCVRAPTWILKKLRKRATLGMAVRIKK